MSDRLIFICYSEKDTKWMKLLQAQLGVLEQDGVQVFNKTTIGAGEDWVQRVEEALGKACVAVLLVSPDTLGPDFILKDEIKKVLTLRYEEGLRIFPIIVESCLWKRVDWLKRMGVRPSDQRPLQGRSAAKRAEELTSIVSEIAIIVDSAAELASPPGPTVLPESPDRVSKADTSPTAPIESSRAVQDLKAKRDKYLEKISELDRQIESSSSQTSPAGVATNPPASFGEGPGESISSQTITKPLESER
jgi:TIR domain-containing protein